MGPGSFLCPTDEGERVQETKDTAEGKEMLERQKKTGTSETTRPQQRDLNRTEMRKLRRTQHK